MAFIFSLCNGVILIVSISKMSTFDIESTVVSQGSCSCSHTPASSKTSKGSQKVMEHHFTPRTHQLAIASKAHVRTHIVYHPIGPFNPVNGCLARMDFAWTTVKETAANSNDSNMKDAFKRASKNDSIKKDLLTFVSLLLIDW